ncbi:MAG TPA: packaged DNA stabilization protein [Ramlibacter sp.]|uniref:packaged DNA stabilization protein n=1 Tax=Ramlibacter sp. TaxID=1917967 RepID=UPI002ED0F80F
MQIPLLGGITSDANADWRSSLSINLIPVPKDTGPSKGYFRFAPGLTQFASGPGIDRGAINWNDLCYRVMGGQLARVNADGTATNIGAISGTGGAILDYGPVYLLIVSDNKAWLYNGASLVQITDVDLGNVIDGLWVDGYYLFTDGTALIVTELTDPFAIDPLKYGSSEADPDRIKGLLKYRGEVYAFNRYTTEAFENVGGAGFPFRRIESAMMMKGCVGPQAKTLFAESFAWLGSGRNEPCSVYVASGGAPMKIATREVEKRLKAYTEAQLATAVLEARADELHQHLLVHLPGETLVYDAAASVAAEQPIWFFLSTGVVGVNAYRARNFVWCYGKWLCGDTQDGRVGYVNEAVCTQYEAIAGWQFDTLMVYNEGNGATVWSLELVGTTGHAPGTDDPTVFHSYTVDGLNWSLERTARMGSAGQTAQRVVWRRCGRVQHVRGERFRGANKTPISWSRLEAKMEPLSG